MWRTYSTFDFTPAAEDQHLVRAPADDWDIIGGQTSWGTDGQTDHKHGYGGDNSCEPYAGDNSCEPPPEPPVGGSHYLPPEWFVNDGYF